MKLSVSYSVVTEEISMCGGNNEIPGFPLCVYSLLYPPPDCLLYTSCPKVLADINIIVTNTSANKTASRREVNSTLEAKLKQRDIRGSTAVVSLASMQNICSVSQW
jgi:hypothetical protein